MASFTVEDAKGQKSIPNLQSQALAKTTSKSNAKRRQVRRCYSTPCGRDWGTIYTIDHANTYFWSCRNPLMDEWNVPKFVILA